MKDRGNLLEALSRLLNYLVFFGTVDESVSARSYRLSDKSKVWKFSYMTINTLFFWQNNHCRGAHNNSRKRMKEFLDASG